MHCVHHSAEGFAL